MSSTRAIIKITALGKSSFLINYSRRMYAIVRRYTPEGIEGNRSECYADITGLRTFYKKTYKELADAMVRDIESEVGVDFAFLVATTFIQSTTPLVWRR